MTIDCHPLQPISPLTLHIGSAKPPRHSKGEHFLKGPIPWKWLTSVAPLGGKALQVGIALWYLAGMRKSARVQLVPSVLQELSVSRYAAYRALGALESAQLVRVERHRGRSPVVTILEAPPTRADFGKGAKGASHAKREIWEDLFLELPGTMQE
jgi:hypothetical protein